MNIALVFLPAKDIALYVGEGKVDLGITGLDVIRESGVQVEHLLDFDFGICNLCLLSPKQSKYSPTELVGKRIATSFPRLTRTFFQTLDPAETTKIRSVSGSVESCCALGLADGIVDLVETGETIIAAGLEIVEVVMRTNAALIGNARSRHKNLMKRIHSRLTGVVVAERYALIEYNISREALENAKLLTPGKTSPTVSPLEKTGWVAVKAMILLSQTNELIEKLHAVGATDILVYRIDNCRF